MRCLITVAAALLVAVPTAHAQHGADANVNARAAARGHKADKQVNQVESSSQWSPAQVARRKAWVANAKANGDTASVKALAHGKAARKGNVAKAKTRSMALSRAINRRMDGGELDAKDKAQIKMMLSNRAKQARWGYAPESAGRGQVKFRAPGRDNPSKMRSIDASKQAKANRR